MGFGGYIGTTGTKGPIDVLSLRKDHNKWAAAHDRVLRSTMLEIGDDAIAHARAQKSVENRSGALARSWRKAWQAKIDRYSVALISSLPHALFQERGTGIYGPTGKRIYPKRAMFLRWVSPSGKLIFARSVKGVPAKFIGKHAAFEAWGFGKSKLLRATDRLASRF